MAYRLMLLSFLFAVLAYPQSFYPGDPRLTSDCPSSNYTFGIQKAEQGYMLSGIVELRNNVYCVWAAGCTHQWHGRSEDVLGLFRLIESDSADPLTFYIDWREGYVYKKGKGKVVLASGELFLFPDTVRGSTMQIAGTWLGRTSVPGLDVILTFSVKPNNKNLDYLKLSYLTSGERGGAITADFPHLPIVRSNNRLEFTVTIRDSHAVAFTSDSTATYTIMHGERVNSIPIPARIAVRKVKQNPIGNEPGDWVVMNPSSPSQFRLWDITSAYVLNEKTILACALKDSIYKTTDAGKKWKAINRVGGRLWFLRAMDAKTWWGAGLGAVTRTTDGGQHWTVVSPKTSESLRSIFPISGTECFAGFGEGAIAHTTDGGQNWTKQESGKQEVYDLYFVDPQRGWATKPFGGVIYTTDGGNRWISPPGKLSYDARRYQAICFVDSSTGYGVGGNGHIAKTIDGGLTWVSQSSNTREFLSLVFFIDAYQGWAFGRNGVIMNTLDGGHSWICRQSKSLAEFKHVSSPDNVTVWAVCENGVILRTNAGPPSMPPMRSKPIIARQNAPASRRQAKTQLSRQEPLPQVQGEERTKQLEMPDVKLRYRLRDEDKVSGKMSIDAKGNWTFTLPQKGVVVGSLTFEDTTPCRITILTKDKTLLADRDGIKAKDRSGTIWVSREMELNGKKVKAFFVSR